MKTTFLIRALMAFCILYSINVQGQNIANCNLNIDSLFQAHFLSLDTIIKCDSVRKFVPNNDRHFVYLVGFLSGITFKLHSYTGTPMLNYKDLVLYKIWFNRNRYKIKCETVKRGFLLLSGELTEQTLYELDKLRIN